MTLAPLRPSLDPDRLFPRRAAFMGRTDLRETRLLGFTPLNADGVTSMLLGLLGDRPAVRHEAGAGPEVRALLGRAGLEWRERTLLYRDLDEAERHADRLVADGFRLFSPYPLRNGRFPDDAMLVPPPLWRALNAKERLGDLVPPEHLAPRRILPIREVKGLSFERPVFLKAGGELATGWGYAVRACADAGALEAAKAWFLARARDIPSVIVEEAVDVVASWCAGIAISDGESVCFGAAEQLFSAPGKQSGSIIDPDRPPPPESLRLAEAVGDEARRRGYRGIAGLDIGLARDGRILVFDPNFRVNASTAQVLLHPGAARRSGLEASAWLNVAPAMPFPALEERLLAPIDEGWFVPTRIFNGERHEHAEGRHMVTGFALGSDRAAAESAAARLRARLGA